MTPTFPAGAVDEWPDSDSEIVAAFDPDPALLLSIATAYHQAQDLLTTRTQWLTRDLWTRMRPVNDASMGEWMQAWDSLLGASSRQQINLTESWSRMSHRAFGTAPAAVEVKSSKAAEAEVERWLTGDYAKLDADLHDEAEALLARLQNKRATLPDLAQADRLNWLHSPVVKGRTALAGGLDLAVVEPSLDVTVDAALRTNEHDTIEAIDWPRFKNGKAMLAKRVPTAGACGWCRVVATRLYSLETMERGGAWHAHCRCRFVPATEAEVRAYIDALRTADGLDYYAAAAAIGVWEGPTGKGAYSKVINQRSVPEQPDAPERGRAGASEPSIKEGRSTS